MESDSQGHFSAQQDSGGPPKNAKNHEKLSHVRREGNVIWTFFHRTTLYGPPIKKNPYGLSDSGKPILSASLQR